MADIEKVIHDLSEWCDAMDELCPVICLDALALLKEQPRITRCNGCKYGSIYCTDDVCGETLIECNHPDLGDTIAIHAWNWYCADGEVKIDA